MVYAKLHARKAAYFAIIIEYIMAMTTIRISPEAHRVLKLASESKGISLNAWVRINEYSSSCHDVTSFAVDRF